MFGLTRVQILVIAGLVVVALTASALFYVYHKGENAGASGAAAKVNADTVKAVDAARRDKERTDGKVRGTGIDDVINGLR